MKKTEMNKASIKYTKKNEAGVALAIVALVLLVLTLLIISAHFTTITQTSTTANYRNSTQAFYVAEAGIQRSLDWFSHQYNPPSPTNLPDWATYMGPTGVAGNGDTMYPNRLTLVAGAPPVILSTDSAVASTFPIATVVTSFQNYLNTNVNNYSTSATGTNLQGRYTVRATLLSTKLASSFGGGKSRIERWRVNSLGEWRDSVNGNALARAENVAVIETLTSPAVNNAVCANTFDFKGGSFLVDSYDPTIPPNTYAGTVQNNGGVGSFAGSAGPFSLGSGNSTNIGGQVSVPTGNPARPAICGQTGQGCGTNFCPPLPAIPTFCPSSTATGVTPLASPNPLASPATFSYTATSNCSIGGTPSGPGCGSIPASNDGGNISSTKSLGLPPSFSGAACFWIKNINLTGGDILTINNTANRAGSGPMNVYIDEIKSAGTAGIVIVSSTASPVNLYVKSALDVAGNAITNSPTNPQGLFIYYSGTAQAHLHGDVNTGLVLYAPNAQTKISGSAEYFGAINTNDFLSTGGTQIHFDRSLAKNLVTVFGFVPNSQVRRVY